MRSFRPPARRVLAFGFALVLAPMAFAAPVAASAVPAGPSVETYTLGGYEVFFGADHAVFLGTGSGTGGPRDVSGWYTSVYHTLSIAPGNVTGGTAGLQRIDGVQINGDFTGGDVAQIAGGDNCTGQTFAVTALVGNVTRSDKPGKTGTAVMMAQLTHYRSWFLGTCYVYSARVDGTITVIV